jgi:hypothetical protein
MLHAKEFAAASTDLNKALEIDPTDMAILRYSSKLFLSCFMK